MIENESKTLTTMTHDSMNREGQNQENVVQKPLDIKTLYGDEGEDAVKAELIKDVSLQHNVFPSTEIGNSIFLQCSLNVWHVVNHDSGSLNHALCDLLESATHISEDQWLVHC